MQLRRRSRSNPTWNIQDEIRKVRAKATEEMLKTVSPRSVASLNVDGGAQGVFFSFLFSCVNKCFSVYGNMR